VQDTIARSRVREEEVTLLRGIPERFKVQLHQEMYMQPLIQLQIWPTWTGHQDEKEFLSMVCHESMTEQMLRPGQDVFMTFSPCTMVYVLQVGAMEYAPERGMPEVCRPDSANGVVSLAGLWAEWEHVGRLTAAFGTCSHVGLDCRKFSQLAANFGGHLCEFLKILGILMLAQIDALEAAGTTVSDVNVQTLINMSSLAQRGERFVAMRVSLSANPIPSSTVRRTSEVLSAGAKRLFSPA